MYNYRSNSNSIVQVVQTLQANPSIYVHITDITINHFTKHSTSDWTGGVVRFLAPLLHLCCQDDLTELGSLAKHPAANIIKSFGPK